MAKDFFNSKLRNTDNKKPLSRKFLLLSNTSKYIKHYRLMLLYELKNNFKSVFLLAPKDDYSIDLSKIINYQSWELSPSSEFNLLRLFISLYKLFFKLKKLKPYIVHSHTIKPNLLVSLAGFFLSINLVISFAGMGRMSNSKGIKLFLFKTTLRIIYFTAVYELTNFIFFKKKYGRVKFIFQNPIDLKFFHNLIGINTDKSLLYLIPGSGVPERYFKSIKLYSNEKGKIYDFIYCSRLLSSKGINLFIKLSKYFPKSRFFVYGALDGKEEDHLSLDEINLHKKENKNIFFMGHVDDPLLKHHNDHSIFILPSLYGEGLPRGILEAMALEIPIITNVKSCVGLFDKKTLFVVKDNELDSYKERVYEILKTKDKKILNDFLQNAREEVIEKYREFKIVNDTMKIYQSFDETIYF